MIYELRSGGQWKQHNSVPLKVFFHIICRRHGSQAIWLQDLAKLMTIDPDETEKNYPYEEWLDEALTVSELYNAAD